MGWADRLAGRSSHRSAQNYVPTQGVERPTAPSKDGVRTESARKLTQDTWGVRYGQEVGDLGLRKTGKEYPMPGTPEFTARYIPPPERIERIVPHGPEGLGTVQCDVDGNPLTGFVKPLPLEGPGPIVR